MEIRGAREEAREGVWPEISEPALPKCEGHPWRTEPPPRLCSSETGVRPLAELPHWVPKSKGAR